MRRFACALTVCVLTLTLSAAELGRAGGTLTIDRNRIALAYAYAIAHQRNEITGRKDETKVVLTENPLADNLDFTQIEATLPDGIYALTFNVTPNGKVTHVFLLYPKGSYDGGYLEEMPDFRFKNANGSRGTVAGRITSGNIRTNTMTFSVDADFNALVK